MKQSGHQPKLRTEGQPASPNCQPAVYNSENAMDRGNKRLQMLLHWASSAIAMKALYSEKPPFSGATVFSVDGKKGNVLSPSYLSTCMHFFHQPLHCKLQTRPLVREGALQEEQQRNCHWRKDKDKFWSWAPKVRLIPRRTGRLTVGSKINSTQLIFEILYYWICGPRPQSNIANIRHFWKRISSVLKLRSCETLGRTR
jgi:hypothetical protein